MIKDILRGFFGGLFITLLFAVISPWIALFFIKYFTFVMSFR